MQNLAVWGFLVAEKQIAVHRHVLLAIWVVDLGGGEEGIHTEGSRLVRDDHLDSLTCTIGLQKVLQHAHERHGGSDFLVA